MTSKPKTRQELLDEIENLKIQLREAVRENIRVGYERRFWKRRWDDLVRQENEGK